MVSSLTDVAIILLFIGFGFIGIVDLKRKINNKSLNTPIFKDLTAVDKKFMIIGALIALLGLLIIVIIRLTVGGSIKLG